MPFRGCFAAIVTPFDGPRIDEDALARHAAWLADNGCDGLVVNGTTGESAALTDDERIRIMNVVCEAAGDRATIVGGAGNNETNASIHLVKRVCAETPVDAVMSVVPYYVKPAQDGLIAHFRALLDASTLPMVLYNVPGRTVVSMTAETMATLAADERVVAIKEASANMVLGSRTLELVGEDAAILSGDDATTFPLMAMGATGAISVVANCAPQLVHRLTHATLEGDLETARALQPEMLAWFDLLFSEPNPLPTKVVVASLGFGSDVPRLPHARLDAETRNRIIARAQELGACR